ncbi:MAG: hypothetical protein HC819_21675 [Cyclobacteriaceae bacterium]|nr:hypothetical protein [Cyclobacteriaceae bacterium]
MITEIVDYLPYLSIPIVSALVGWITNIVALRMTFYPLRYIGIRPFGWQGIIPAKAGKMASIAVELWTTKLLDISKQFSKIEPDKVAYAMGPAIDNLARQIIDEVMEAKLSKVWARTPQPMKERAYAKVSENLPGVVSEMMKEVKVNLTEMLDLRYLAVSSLTKNKSLLNQMFLKCGEQEFKFIKRSGLYFGFAFGLLQMLVWYFFPFWWILPLCGLLVGYVTNYLALKLIFKPLNPIKIGNITIQGMFIKRQVEVAEEYSSMVTSRILTIENIFEYIIRGPGSVKLALIVQKQIEHTIEETAGLLKSLVDISMGSQLFVHIRNIACFRFMQELPMNIRHVFGYAENALNLKQILRDKMVELSPVEFEAFLHPVFKEDETTLILIGALLGGIAGLLQYLLFF